MKTLTQYGSMILVLIIALTQSSCVYYKETSNAPPPDNLFESSISAKYVICQNITGSNTTAWHLKPVILSEDMQTITAVPKLIDQNSIGIETSKPKLKVRHKAKRAAERDEIHIYTRDLILIENQTIKIPVDSIFRSKEYVIDQKNTITAHVVSITTAATIILAISSISIGMNFGNLTGF